MAQTDSAPSLPANVVRRLMHSSGHRMALQLNSKTTLMLAQEDLDMVLRSAVSMTLAKRTSRLNYSSVMYGMRQNGVALIETKRAKKTARKKTARPGAKSAASNAEDDNDEDEDDDDDEDDAVDDGTDVREEVESVDGSEVTTAAKDDLGWD